MYSPTFNASDFVATRVAGRSRGAQAFALAIARHLEPVGRDLATRGIRMRELAAEADISLKAAQRIAAELCSGPDPVFEKDVVKLPNPGTFGERGLFPTVAVTSFVLVPPRF